MAQAIKKAVAPQPNSLEHLDGLLSYYGPTLKGVSEKANRCRPTRSSSSTLGGARLERVVLMCTALVGLASLGHDTCETGTFECRIEDTDTDASLEHAGVNPTCPDSGSPWACYCELEEVCESDSGDELTFKRRVLLGCGSLGDCSHFSPFGQKCDASHGRLAQAAD